MKIKKNYIYAGIAIVLLAILGLAYFKYTPTSKKPIASSVKNEDIQWMVDKKGYLYYPLKREQIKFHREELNGTGNLSVSKIIYPSKNGNIFGLLVLPKNITHEIPGVVLLPGAGVSKESELPLAEKIALLGIAVLAIDQRGVGETDGGFPTLDEDFASFSASREPYYHLMVYDALRGFDLLYSAPFVDPNHIILAGESLGGRNAIIAAAIDRNIKGVLAISSAGFRGIGYTSGNDNMKNAFIDSIDSDHYISLIAPRKIVMIHNVNDRNILIQSAVNSFSYAQQPKRFIYVNDTSCNHGYCDSMYSGLVDSLQFVMR